MYESTQHKSNMYRNTHSKQIKKNNHNDKKKQDYSNLIMNVIRSNHVKKKKTRKNGPQTSVG